MQKKSAFDFKYMETKALFFCMYVYGALNQIESTFFLKYLETTFRMDYI